MNWIKKLFNRHEHEWVVVHSQLVDFGMRKAYCMECKTCGKVTTKII
jgi:hypothetical protein